MYSPTSEVMGVMMRTAASGAGEEASRGRVFQPHGWAGIVPVA